MATLSNKHSAKLDSRSYNRYAEAKLSKFIKDNLELIKNIFDRDHTLVITDFMNQSDTLKCAVVFIDGMADKMIISRSIIEPIIQNQQKDVLDYGIDYIMQHIISPNETKKTSSVPDIISAILIGNAVLFLDHMDEVIIINTIGWKTRAIAEPEGEKALRGPREGFTESLITNLSLIRRKLLTPDLKFEFMELGKRTHTRLCICYLDGLVNKKILKELYTRLDSFDMDGLLSSGYIQEYIKDAPLSPFKTIGTTERPDIIAGKLLEGRIAVIFEGTPVALTLPYVFIEYFQSNEDYYTSFYYSSINRMLRVLSFIIAICVPSIYVALTTFHHEMIPTQLAMSIAASKEGVPFPTIIEALVLLTVFEILRETGTRMPPYIGQALSIVGALVLGQAAVEARLVSAPIVIVVALASITTLMIPKIIGVVIITRTIFLFLSSVLGLYGLAFGVSGLLLHLFELRSFGVPYMLGLMNFTPQDVKDTVFRAPWWYMKYRPKFIAADSKRKGDERKRP